VHARARKARRRIREQGGDQLADNSARRNGAGWELRDRLEDHSRVGWEGLRGVEDFEEHFPVLNNPK
jgi:hypothetical protein